MPEDNPDPPVLNYAAVQPAKIAIVALRRMLVWRSVLMWSEFAFFGGFLGAKLAGGGDSSLMAAIAILFLLLTLVALLSCVVASIVTLIYMTIVALKVGIGYAMRQLGFALVFMPLLFLGPLVVPLLVESDMIK